MSQAAPFFANSDPEMPDVPVPAAQVHDWLLQHISASLEHAAETEIVKDNGLVRPADQDVPMADASVNSTGLQNNVAYSRSQVFVEGFYKTSVVKQAHDIKGDSIKVKLEVLNVIGGEFLLDSIFYHVSIVMQSFSLTS